MILITKKNFDEKKKFILVITILIGDKIYKLLKYLIYIINGIGIRYLYTVYGNY